MRRRWSLMARTRSWDSNLEDSHQPNEFASSPGSDFGSRFGLDDLTMGQRAAKHWRRFTKWVESTTFHGFDQIVLSHSWLARIFWSLTMVVVFIIVFIQLRKLIVYFIDNPTLTSIQLVYPQDGMGLPPLTLCTLTKLNQSAVRSMYPQVNQTLTEFATSSFLSAYSTALMDPLYFKRKGHDLDELEETLFAALKHDGSNFTGFIEDHKKQLLPGWWTKIHMVEKGNCAKNSAKRRDAKEQRQKPWRDANGVIQKMGSSLKWRSKVVLLALHTLVFTVTDVKIEMATWRHPAHSFCMLGPVGGFGFVYWYPNEHLVESAYNGYDEHAVHLYMSPTDALLEKNPIALPVGYHTHISLTVGGATKTVRMKYDELGRSTCETPELKYFSNYSFPACQVECLIDAMITRCNCTGLSSYGRIPQDRVCTPAQALQCYRTQAPVFPNLLVKCRKEKCIEACEYWSYQASLTVGKVFNPKLKDKMLEYWRLPEGDPDLSLIIGDVYFEEIQYTEVTQMPALTIEAFISSIGGAMGLWTGASIITWIHLVYFCCNYMCFGKSPLKAATAVRLRNGQSRINELPQQLGTVPSPSPKSTFQPANTLKTHRAKSTFLKRSKTIKRHNERAGTARGRRSAPMETSAAAAARRNGDGTQPGESPSSHLQQSSDTEAIVMQVPVSDPVKCHVECEVSKVM